MQDYVKTFIELRNDYAVAMKMSQTNRLKQVKACRSTWGDLVQGAEDLLGINMEEIRNKWFQE